MVENKDTNKRFIMINHNFFKQDKYIFSVLKPEGFTIYCYLLYKKSSLSYAEINLKMIKDSAMKSIKKYCQEHDIDFSSIAEAWLNYTTEEK